MRELIAHSRDRSDDIADDKSKEVNRWCYIVIVRLQAPSQDVEKIIDGTSPKDS